MDKQAHTPSQHPMVKYRYFKAAKDTRRFRKNQIVWVTMNGANHLYIRFKYKGKGRYVNGIADKHANYVGEIKTMDISKLFADRLQIK